MSLKFSYLIFKIKFNNLLLKFFIFSILKVSLFITKYILRTNFGLLKFSGDGKKSEYLNEYNKLRKIYENDSFLNSFLKEISVISHDYTNNLKINNKKIHIVANMNNKYIYPSLVSINSVLSKTNQNTTTIVYHILCPEDLRRGNINKLKSLLFIYPSNLEMIFYNMGNLFSQYKKSRFSEVTFYRLLTPLFISVKKIIYLDCDVLAFEDLQEMYEIPLNNIYISGFLDFLSNGVDYLGLKSDKYINAGVLLINLELIRKYKKYDELLYMVKNIKNLENNDQTIINYVFYPNIGILPSKFGIFNFDSIFDIKYIYLKTIRQNINITELIEAFKHPSLMHYVLCDPKIWNSNSFFSKKRTKSGTIYKSSCKKYHDIWIENAKKTIFFKEISKCYKNKR